MKKRKDEKRQGRIYWRSGRAWGDFRSHADVGGSREPLIASGERVGTSDPVVAQALVTARLKELDAQRHGRALHGRAQGTPLAAYAAEHLQKKAKAAKVTRDWIAAAEVFLQRAVDFLGAERDLESITVEDVQSWAAHLATLPAKRDTRKPKNGQPLPPREQHTMSSGTVRHSLNALSNLYRRAQAEGRSHPDSIRSVRC